MIYPTSEEIEAADVVQLTRWLRFLPSPGLSHIMAAALIGPGDEYMAAVRTERQKLVRIQERLHALGGITPSAASRPRPAKPSAGRRLFSFSLTISRGTP